MSGNDISGCSGMGGGDSVQKLRSLHSAPSAHTATPDGVAAHAVLDAPDSAASDSLRSLHSVPSAHTATPDGVAAHAVLDAPLGSVLILGLGKSGKAAARYCCELLGSRVSRMFVAAGAETDDSHAFLDELASTGAVFSYAFGDDALETVDDAFDLCIASPGIPYWHPLYQAGLAHSVQLISEVEFAWRESAPDSIWVAITGTNGKTTTTACTAAVLREAGFAADAVGNIGDVCLNAVAAGKTQVYVAEVSSYQLYSTIDFAPDVAVLMNITPDHIHWHKTLEAYAEAKFKLLANLGKTGQRAPSAGPRVPVAILDATNDVVRAKVREIKAVPADERRFAYIPMGTKAGIEGDMRAACGADNAAFLGEDGMLHVAYLGIDHAILPAADLQIPGRHNVGNALLAAAVAVALGADDAAIARGLASFAPIEHRIEPCGIVHGAACYNDSKATNVDATLKALEAFPEARPIVLLGGDDKGTDLDELVAAVHAHTRAAVCFGEAGPRFAAALRGDTAPAGFTLIEAAHMEDALDAALSIAGAGDIVLLSPACASFDEFRSFEHRGDEFKRMVRERADRQGV